jgi:DNA gyrase subunit A
MTEGHSSIILRNVEDEMKESYLRYSMSVIISRALPDVRDGLKPSQRRILYAMRQLNLSPNAKHRKCAKISGDTSGDYHPHGEQVIYPTLARLAQSWVMRYTLIQGQGNFGSVDGDPPAAMRYTEARLTQASVELMEDLDKDTVDVIPNYDETRTEPTVFPAKFPNLLANGSSGIAVGMATNIPPHHVGELIEATKLVLHNRAVTIEQILDVMPGPDFPTGAIIYGKAGIRSAYATGRGKVFIRARWHLEESKGGHDKDKVVVTEIPYNVNKSRLIEHIADLVNDKNIQSIADIRDESDKDGMRIVLELKRGESAEIVMNQLYKFTDMQVTFGCNLLALDKGLPRLMNVRQLIGAWVDHRMEVIRRRTRFELKKAENRAHILEGYLIALDHLDEVIRIIRSASDKEMAKNELISLYKMSEKQSAAVLELRLYQITGLERDKVLNEHQELLIKIADLKAILSSDERIRSIISDELDAIRHNHKEGRRSEIIDGEINVETEDLIANDTVIITLSQDDYLKRMPIDTFREQKRGGVGVTGMQMRREDDSLKHLYVANMHDYLMLFTNFGRVYWLKVWQIPDTGRKSKGKPLVQFLEGLQEKEKVATVLKVSSYDEPGAILLCSKKGIIKKTDLSSFNNPRRKGVQAVVIDEGDEIMAARIVKPKDKVMLFTYDGMAVRFDEEDARSMGRVARGVRGVRLKGEEDRVVGCEIVQDEDTIVVVCENGYGKRTRVSEFRETRRGSMGVRSIITSERNGGVMGAINVNETHSLLMMSMNGQAVRIPVSQLRVMGRSTQGVRLANIKDSDRIVAIQHVARDEVEPEEGDLIIEESLEPKVLVDLELEGKVLSEVAEDDEIASTDLAMLPAEDETLKPEN